MKLEFSIFLAIMLYAMCGKTQTQAIKRPEKPNVVIILIDDLGWQDIKCYDIDEPSPYETPNIDKLAKGGVMFWQAYSPAPTCSPSRGAILSGKHPARLQRTHVVGGGPPVPDNEIGSNIITPFYLGRLRLEEEVIPESLKKNGYYTGHVGKWHLAIGHNDSPTPKEHGFDYSKSNRGVTTPGSNRLAEFATSNESDAYQLDENGFPRDQNNIDALDFLKKANSDKPFFLYYPTWLVHAPIHTRSKALLEKYCKKMGVPFPTDPTKWDLKGQKNPYYASMVEMMDYYIGQLINHLKTTDDARWSGHKLIENTYIIFNSDNGGMERMPNEEITDNYPLDMGKIHAEEGGIRVPLIISGPGIAPNQQTNVIANGIDFYPTILKWTKSKAEPGQIFDGADLSKMLSENPQNPKLVLNQNGSVRNSVMHHFPHASSMKSTIRIGDYKLIRSYDPAKQTLELYKLYEKGTERVDIEEKKDLSKKMYDKASQMNILLQNELESMGASFPYLNPYSSYNVSKKPLIPTVISVNQYGDQVTFTYKESGNKVLKANLIYTLNGGKRNEEWFKTDAKVLDGNMVKVSIPKGATHFVLNLIDDHNYLVSYPKLGDTRKYKEVNYSTNAIKVGNKN